MNRRDLIAGLILAGGLPALARAQAPTAPKGPAPKGGNMTTLNSTGYLTVGGLKIWYETHGAGGVPLVMLHGGFMSTDAIGPLVPALAARRQVILLDLEGHGRTRDLDRPLSTDQMGRDVGGFIKQAGLGKVDVFGFSMGGMAAQRVAFHFPDLVRKLILVSTGYSNDSFHPGITAQWPGLNAAGMKGTPMEELYAKVAPDPAHFPAFVDKMREMMVGFPGWPKSDLQAIKAPTLLMLGDTDLVRLDYNVEMFRLLGGAATNGMEAMPASRFAVLPATTHFDILYKLDLLVPMITGFLDGDAKTGAFDPRG